MIPDRGSKIGAPGLLFSILDRSSRSSGALGRPFCVLRAFCARTWPVRPRFCSPGLSPDGLDVDFGSRNGVICKVSGERTGFVASIDFSYDFHVFSKLFFDRLISQFSIMSSIACAFDRKRLRWLKPRKTLAGATKIKVRR